MHPAFQEIVYESRRKEVQLMGNYVNTANAGFAAAVRDTYVDKTELIAFINSTLGTKRKLTCVSRPRRFGKSYAAQMLCAYYDKSCDSSGLFANLKIAPVSYTHLTLPTTSRV